MRKIWFLAAGMGLFLLRPAHGVDNRILLIGDSITQGKKSSDAVGFRNDLYDSLKAVGYPFTFGGKSGSYPYYGHFKSGGRIHEFYTGPGGDGTFDVDASMDSYKPHVVVVHLGTNDAFDTSSIRPYKTSSGELRSDTVCGRLAILIRYLVDWNKGNGRYLKKIFVSRVIPNANNAARIWQLNQEIAQFVHDVQVDSVVGIPKNLVLLVDQYSTFDKNTMFDADGTHPNDLGYAHMGRILFSTMAAQPMLVQVLTSQYISGIPNTEPFDSLSVRITTGIGNGVKGIPVQFEKLDGSATIYGSSDTTDADGIAYVRSKLSSTFDTTRVKTTYESAMINQAVPFYVYARTWIEVDGHVRHYANARPVPDVEIYWSQKASVLGTTDSTGYYVSMEPRQGDGLSLVPSKPRERDWRETGITSYDAALVARHVVGLDTLGELGLIAADVNRDASVLIDDAYRIARYVVGLDTGDTQMAGRWFFSPSDRSSVPVNRDKRNWDFQAVLLGDIHGGWSPDWGGTIGKSGKRAPVRMTVDPGDTTWITVWASAVPLYSCDMDVSFDVPDPHICLHQTPEAGSFTQTINRISGSTMRVGHFSAGGASGENPLFSIGIPGGSEVREITIDAISVNADRFADRINAWVDPEPGTKSRLLYGYPNPFNEEIVIPFRVRERARGRIVLYNILGQRVHVLKDQLFEAGIHSVSWDGRDANGKFMPSGCYLLELTIGSDRWVQKIEKIR